MSTLGRRKGRKRSLESEDRSDAGTASKVPRTQTNPMPRLLPFQGINQGRMAALQAAIDNGLVDDSGWVEGREPNDQAGHGDATSRQRRSVVPSISPTKLAELEARQAQASAAEVPRPIQPRPSATATGRQLQVRPSAERAIQLRPSAPAGARQRQGSFYQEIAGQAPPAQNRPLRPLPMQRGPSRFRGYFDNGTHNAAIGNLPLGFDPTRPQFYYIFPDNVVPPGQQLAAPPLRPAAQNERPIQSIEIDDEEPVEPSVTRAYVEHDVQDAAMDDQQENDSDPGDEIIEVDNYDPAFGDPEAPSYPETQDTPDVDDQEYPGAPVYQHPLETQETVQVVDREYPPSQVYQYAPADYEYLPGPAHYQHRLATEYHHPSGPAYHQYAPDPAHYQPHPAPAGYQFPQADYQHPPAPVLRSQGDEEVEMTFEQYQEAGRWYVPDENRTAMIREYFHMYPITDTEAAMEAYFQKYGKDLQPFDFGDDTDDKLLMCVCLKPDDGRDYIECMNGVKCMKQFFHPGCLGMSIFDIPRQGEDEWYCPACIREGLGGALEHKKRRNRIINKRRTLVRRASTGCVVDQMPGPTIDRPQSRDTKPWSTDLDEKFAANPDNVRDLDIESLSAAKAALRARAAEPLQATRRRPLANRGTIVKQPNRNTWTDREDGILSECMAEANADGLSGNPLWEAVETKLHSRGVHRKIGGARNRWMRGLREATKIDERRKKNARKLTTSVQLPNHLRDPNSARKKKRPSMPRKANAPGTLALGSSPLRHEITAELSSPTAAVGSSPDRQGPMVSASFSTTLVASSSLRRPQVMANTSFGVPGAGSSPLQRELRSGSSSRGHRMLLHNAPYDPDRANKDEDVKMYDYDDDDEDDVRPRLPRKRLGPD